MTIIWCMIPEIWSVTDKIFCHFGPFFALLPLKTLKNQHFEKIKKTSGDIIILHMCTINDSHMMYGFWDMKYDEHNFLSFWTVFCPLTPLTTRKIKILKNWKKTPGDIIISHMCTKFMIPCYTVPEIWRVADALVIFHFGLFFCPFTSLTAQNIKIFKKWRKKKKNTWRYHHFTYIYQKLWSDDVWFLRYGARWTDGRTEKVTYRGGSPPNKSASLVDTRR